MVEKGLKRKLKDIRNAKAIKLRLSIYLTTFCLCLFSLLTINETAFPQDEEDIQKLINSLLKGNFVDRKRAAKALGEIGSKAKSAVPALTEAVLKEDNEDVCVSAAKALAEIDPASKAAAAALIERYKYARIQARLKFFDNVSFDILKALRDFNSATLREIGPDAKAAVPYLILDLNYEYRGLLAKQVLVKIGPAAVPALIDYLKKGENKEVRRDVVPVLEYIGPDAKAAVPYLIEALNEYNLIDLAARALGGIGPDAKAAVPYLIEMLKADNEIYTAAEALGKIGPEAKAALPYLIEMLYGELMGRSTAAEALGKIGPEAKAAVPSLTETLKEALKEGKNEVRSVFIGTDWEGEFRSKAAWALGRMGPAAEAAVPTLIEALEDRNHNVRRNAKDALRSINTTEAQKALKEYKQKVN